MITEKIINALIAAKKGDRSAAREFALLCNAKDEETIKEIMDIVSPINYQKESFLKAFRK